MLDRVTLDQLRILIAVAETGSFSAAARRLRRVQSAISQSMQSLEAALDTAIFDRSGKPPKLTDAGRVLLGDARHVVHSADMLKARAESMAAEVEPELTLAVDAMFPSPVLMASLKALSETFPCLPVTLFTEGLGGPEQRLRDGVARLALYAPLPMGAQDLEAEFLADRTALTTGLSGGIMSRRVWRFADLGSRLDYLLAGFGWCYMPVHLVEEHIAAGRLKRLDIKEDRSRVFSFPIHAIHERARAPGRAGRWLLDDLRRRFAASEAAAEPEPRDAPAAGVMSPRRRRGQVTPSRP